MQTDKCQNCECEFAWDIESGLNVKYFEAEATPRYFRVGGDAPCCPNCDSEVKPGKQEFTTGYITVSTKIAQWKRKEIKRLPEAE